MYIRRKVFSVLNVEGEERLFSTTDFELAEERTFSEKEGLSKKEIAAIGSAAALAAVATATVGGKKLGQRMVKLAQEQRKAVHADKAAGKIGDEYIESLKKLAKKEKLGEALQKPADVVVEVAKKAKGAVVDKSKEAAGKVRAFVSKNKPAKKD